MEMQDPTPLSVAQSQIVALQSKLYALECKVNDLIDALPMSKATWDRVKPIKQRKLL